MACSAHPSLCVRRWWAGLGLAAALAGCGGGDFVEALVKLVTARFNPQAVSMVRSSTRTVELEIRCDRAGLDTAFGRLGVRVKLDPDHTLAAGVTATQGGNVDSQGFAPYACTAATSDPKLHVAHVPVQLTATAAATAGTTTLVAYVEVEPLVSGEPSQDNTQAKLAITVGDGTNPDVGFGSNLLLNPTFDDAVALGMLPTAPGNWRGDLGAVVSTDMGIVPHGGLSMLKIQATGAAPSADTLSEQWQLVELGAFAAAIAAGGVRADLSGWFNRVAFGELTDRRFDLRMMAFDGSPADLPARYAASAWLAEATGPLVSSGNLWQRVGVSLVLPPGTTYVLVEIVASEDVFNDGESVEFAGHYADDTSLVLIGPSGEGSWDY